MHAKIAIALKGLHKTTKVLADGTRKTYYYAWKGGPKMRAEYGTPEFIREFHEHHAALRNPDTSTVAWLITRYKENELPKLKPATQREYRRYIAMIEERFGDMPIAALEEQGARAVFKDWRQEMAHTPRKADLAWSVLQRIFSVALDDELIGRNPCEAAGRLAEAGTRKDIIWTEEEKHLVEQMVPPHIYEAFLLAWWTGQREGDLLRLKWSAYDGAYIQLRQGKRGKHVRVKVSQELKRMLDRKRAALIGREIASLTVLTNSRGQPWTESGFRASWGKAIVRTKIKGKTFHDLRGTFVTNARRSGSSIEDIAEMTGHSIADVKSILEVHYLAASDTTSDAVILRMEKKKK